MNIATTGPVNFQNITANLRGVPIDVDFVLWGPFANQAAAVCGGISAANIVACSYSTAAVGTAFDTHRNSGSMVYDTDHELCRPGWGNQLSQTNANSPGAGSTNCNILTAIPGACTGGLFHIDGNGNYSITSRFRHPNYY